MLYQETGKNHSGSPYQPNGLELLVRYVDSTNKTAATPESFARQFCADLKLLVMHRPDLLGPASAVLDAIRLPNDVIRCGDFTYDFALCELTTPYGSNPIRFQPVPGILFSQLILHEGQYVPNDKLLRLVWGVGPSKRYLVSTNISRLRDAMGEAKPHIRNNPYNGYGFFKSVL